MWYFDCPCKTSSIFYITFRDSIQHALKDTTVVVPLIMDENVAKKPKKTKSKSKRPILLLHDNNNDVQVQSSLTNLVVIGHPSSNQEPRYHASKRQKTTPSPMFDMPRKFRGRLNVLVLLSENYTSSYLILNDCFVRIIKNKKQTCIFRTLYDDIVVILSQAFRFYNSFCVL